MSRGHDLALALALLTASLVGLTATAAAPGSVEALLQTLEIAPLKGEPPPFTLPGLDGKPQALADLKGQVALLYFWATW